MKLLITSINDEFPQKTHAANNDRLEYLFALLKNKIAVEQNPIIELTDEQSIHRQIESALDKMDMTILLDPMMLNTGGMEVLAKLKQELTSDIEAKLRERIH